MPYLFLTYCSFRIDDSFFYKLQMPTERPDLPSLDDALALPDNATFPITETPPPGYMTDENEPVSPSSSAGKYLFLLITPSRI